MVFFSLTVSIYSKWKGAVFLMAKKGTKFKRYSPEFKKEVVKAYLSGEYGGMDKVVQEFGLKSKAQVYQWLKRYREDPELLEIDGRYLGKKDGVNKGKPKKVKLDELSKDEQIEQLKMEVAILKKAKALQKQFGEQ